MQIALLAIAVGVVHASVGVEVIRRACRTQALELAERLAAYHCRHLTQVKPLITHPDLEGNVDTMLDWTGCAYEEYDFVHGGIPRPLALFPTTARGMMVSCLLQHSTVNFIRDTPYEGDIQDPSRCPEEVLDIHIYDPLNYSRDVLDNLNIDAMLLMLYRPPCLDMVMSGFAREYVEKVVLSGQPDPPGIVEQIQGIRLKNLKFEMQNMPNGVEWPTLWSYLKGWKKGVLKGWTLEYLRGPKKLPTCTVWYYEHKSKP